MMSPSTTISDRAAVLDRFTRIRSRTRALFDLVDASVYYERPIPLRNPVVFYEGHLPAFAVNTLLKKALRRPGIDDRLETIFARGIDPESEASALARGNPAWPSRDDVREYAAAADRAIEEAIVSADLERGDQPLLQRAQALWTILEHEEMHQETLAYMWHQLPYTAKRKPEGYVTLPDASSMPGLANGMNSVPGSWRPSPLRYAGVESGPAGHSDRVRIPAGIAVLGTDPEEMVFGWDNELPAHEVAVDAFSIDVHDVTNARFMEFVAAGGYGDPRWWRPEDWSWVASERVTHPHFWERVDGRWYWRAMFERVPLPESWPVYVTWAEARAYARWRGQRLPSEAEFHRAAFATPDGPSTRSAGSGPPNNFDFWRWDPEPVGSHPESASAFGVHDLVGNGWEWTSTPFAPFDGFVPSPSYPEYSADFFDGEHFVMKGASPVTAAALTRRGFRNWFRPRYPYVYAAFRCVTPAFDESSAGKPA